MKLSKKGKLLLFFVRLAEDSRYINIKDILAVGNGMALLIEKLKTKTVISGARNSIRTSFLNH